MSVAVLITDVHQPAQLLPWAASFARAKRSELLVIIPRRGKGQKVWKTLDVADDNSAICQAILPTAQELGLSCSDAPDQDDLAADATDRLSFQVRELSASHPGQALAESIETLQISLLVIPAPAGKTTGNEVDWQRNLFSNAPCQTMYLRDDAHQRLTDPRVLVAVTGRDEDSVPIKCAAELVRPSDGTLSVIYVGRDEVSNADGIRILQRLLTKSLGSRNLADVKQDVVLADNLTEGIRLYGAADCDLILCGAAGQRSIRRLLDSNFFPNEVPETLPALGIVRRAVPLTSRIVRWMESLAERIVPQLEREHRISLVDRIESSSVWDFDFIALICLATSIAGLGLIDDSGAVIIGAMLVAPLMTPIVGTGLALAQGNAKLIRNAIFTIACAFVLSFLIGAVVLGPYSTGVAELRQLTEQMTDRGQPKQLHVFIGLLSGMAAAYATGRPNLLSALPGVAIAAALVPPLATAGIATWTWQFGIDADNSGKVAAGALVLFGANMLAIIVGTALTFWFVGIRPTKKDKKSQSWPVWLFVALIFITAGLAIIMPYVEPYFYQPAETVAGRRISLMPDDDLSMLPPVQIRNGK